MRRASHQIVAALAAVIVTCAAAIAASPNAKVALRASAAPVTASAHPAPAALLRTNNGKVAAVKPVKAMAHKVSVIRVKARHQRLAWHRPAPSIAVPLDEVRVVAFSQPISTVYVGNPMIADVSVIDSRHAFVLGKGFGATNIVALDANGKQVVNDGVTVFGHTGSTVILHRGTAQATYACAGARCESAPMPGDDRDSFSSHMEQLNAHQDAGVKAANAAR